MLDLKQLPDAVLNGDAKTAKSIAEQALAAGQDPLRLVQDHMMPAILETGLKAFHFGAPMDMTAALAKVPSDIVLCGNLDPAGVFVQLPPEAVKAQTTQLLASTVAQKNFVVSSGCDLPPNAPLASLDAFYEAVNSNRI
jgi:uroporphyrinogen-III decarboxylase